MQLTSGQNVGASGGVTAPGTGAATGGALFIALLAGLGALATRQGWATAGALLLAATVGGL